jgi:hypothetical protein
MQSISHVSGPKFTMPWAFPASYLWTLEHSMSVLSQYHTVIHNNDIQYFITLNGQQKKTCTSRMQTRMESLAEIIFMSKRVQ